MYPDLDQFKNYKFPGQKPSEGIKLLVRKHWVTDFRIASIFFFLAIVPVTLAVTLPILTLDIQVSDNFYLLSLVILIYLLLMLLVTFVKWLNEELDVIVVTNERVISHDQIGLFHQDISETNLDQIQDVHGVEKGLFGHLLHYGTLSVQTGARDTLFHINYVIKPYEAARIILDLRDEFIEKEKLTQTHG